jgi:hypothetical protein
MIRIGNPPYLASTSGRCRRAILIDLRPNVSSNFAIKKLCADYYGTRTGALALEIYDSDWKASLSSFDNGKMWKSGKMSELGFIRLFDFRILPVCLT